MNEATGKCSGECPKRKSSNFETLKANENTPVTEESIRRFLEASSD